MLNSILLSLAVLMAVAILVVGGFYLFSPERMTGSFGLKLPAADADTRAWLRLKGGSGHRIRAGCAGPDADYGFFFGRHRSARTGDHPFWRHVGRSAVGWVEVGGVLDSWRDLFSNACRRPVVDPCPLRDVQQW